MIRVLVCRVGCDPVVESHPGPGGMSLKACQAIVGGYINVVQACYPGTYDVHHVDVICLDDAEGHPFNRYVTAFRAGHPFNRYVTAFRGYQAPIYGDFFLARNHEGETASLTDEDIAHYTCEFTRPTRVAICLVIL